MNEILKVDIAKSIFDWILLTVQIFTDVFIIISVCIIAKDYVRKNKRARIEKAIELARLFADVLVPNIRHIDYLLKDLSNDIENNINYINCPSCQDKVF